MEGVTAADCDPVRGVLRLHPAHRHRPRLRVAPHRRRNDVGHSAGCGRHRHGLGADDGVRHLGEPAFRCRSGSPARARASGLRRYMQTTVGTPTLSAILCFVLIVALTLVITYWAARRTRSTREFYAAGRSVSALQNGLALAGDFMSAASFLGIAGLVAMSGFDGLIYSIGWLVRWPIVMFLIAEPLRNLGRYTFADVVAARLRQTPIRIASATGSLAVISFYLIAQMVGAGNLIRLLFGLPYEAAVVIVGVVMLAYVLFGGMIATTWVQIVKAVLLLFGVTLLTVLVLSRFNFSPGQLYSA